RERPTNQIGVRDVPERIDADQEQDVDLAVRACLEDLPGRAPAFRWEASPRALDLRALGLIAHTAAAGQEPRVDAGAEGPTIARATRDQPHAGPVLLGDRPGNGGRQRMLGESF